LISCIVSRKRAQGGDRAHGGRARLEIDHGHLAEPVAGAEHRGHAGLAVAPAAQDLRLAVQDDVHLTPCFAFAHYHRPGLERRDGEAVRKVGQGFVRQASEEADLAQPGGG
jgi:hypothetical protein